MIMMMMAAALASAPAGPTLTGVDQFELKQAEPKAGTNWVLPNLDYGDGQSCPALVERPLNDRMTLSIGPDCGGEPASRPDPIGPQTP